MSDEDFFIIREKDILTVASMSKEVILMYEAYLLGDQDAEEKKEKTQTQVDSTMGYLGSINNARDIFEKLYRS